MTTEFDKGRAGNAGVKLLENTFFINALMIVGVIGVAYFVLKSLFTGKNNLAGQIGSGAVAAVDTTAKAIVKKGREYVDAADDAVGATDWFVQSAINASALYTDPKLAYAKIRSNFAKAKGVSVDHAVDVGLIPYDDWKEKYWKGSSK